MTELVWANERFRVTGYIRVDNFVHILVLDHDVMQGLRVEHPERAPLYVSADDQ